MLPVDLVAQMVQCGMGRCGMNSSDLREADEKMITENDIVPIPKVLFRMMFIRTTTRSVHN
jgi:hypothetical protein